MSSTARTLPRGRSWLRTLVLLLVVLVAGAPAGFPAPPAVAAESVEYDAFDAARPVAGSAQRAVERPRPCPVRLRPAEAADGTGPRVLPPPARRPHPLDALRTVVLRC